MEKTMEKIFESTLLPVVVVIRSGVVDELKVFNNSVKAVIEAEDFFMDCVKKHNPEEFKLLSKEDKSDILDNGYYEFENSEYNSVCIHWGEYNKSLDN